ncbi:caspase-2 [Elysia marginata]|uniref:Caspase-2 n=1 Tax=Elysia marginata TaxID=1093978 RepID=A0AAV4HVT2_9GAST|nr:caspase-2 [Elysia marginata]
MEAAEREVLIARRVELVEDIDIQGGLFTQLLSRKVLQRRAVNKIKLNRTPEEQVEELLNELPKRECFEDFCEALIADGQEHIVKKYLKAPLTSTAKPKTVEAAPTAIESVPVSSPCAKPSPRTDEAASGESVDSSSNFSQVTVKRPHSASSSSAAVICIREQDNQHLYITYNDEGASPEKRKKALEAGTASVVPFEPDETRYVMKHFVSQESGEQIDSSLMPHIRGTILSPQMILDNPQSVVNNPNISDPLRYSAAFLSSQQWKNLGEIHGSAHHMVHAGGPTNPVSSISSSSEPRPTTVPSLSPSGIQISATAAPPSSLSSPLKDPSSLVNKPEAENAHIRSLLRPQQNQSFTSIEQLKAAKQANFLRSNAATGLGNFQGPQQYLNATGLLNPLKSADLIYRASGLSRSTSLNHCDATDTAAFCGSPTKSIHVNSADHGSLNMSKISAYNDSLDSGLLDMTSENLIKFSAGDVAVASPPSIDSSLFGCAAAVGGGDNGLCDMDQIDLPDGCVNVKVEHCTRQFFLANHKKIPRGLALIINVDEVVGKPARKGTNFDRDNLCNLLCQLHFNIIVYNDKDGLSAQEMVNKLKEFAKLQEHAEMDACFVCLLSHGEEGFIFGTDGKRIPLEEIFMLFGNTNCRGLIGKPKVFIIQACRGGKCLFSLSFTLL